MTPGYTLNLKWKDDFDIPGSLKFFTDKRTVLDTCIVLLYTPSGHAVDANDDDDDYDDNNNNNNNNNN